MASLTTTLFPPISNVNVELITNTSTIPPHILLCLNTTFMVIGNYSKITVAMPQATNVTEIFDGYLNATQCINAATCQAFGIYLQTGVNTTYGSKFKTGCEHSINRRNFEKKYGSYDPRGFFSWPYEYAFPPGEFWMAPVNVTMDKWNDVYPTGDSCHNGPLPKPFPPHNDPAIDTFCLSKNWIKP